MVVPSSSESAQSYGKYIESQSARNATTLQYHPHTPQTGSTQPALPANSATEIGAAAWARQPGMLDAGRDGASAIVTGDGESAGVSCVVMASAMRGANGTIRARQSMWGTMVRFGIGWYAGRLAGNGFGCDDSGRDAWPRRHNGGGCRIMMGAGDGEAGEPARAAGKAGSAYADVTWSETSSNCFVNGAGEESPPAAGGAGSSTRPAAWQGDRLLARRRARRRRMTRERREGKRVSQPLGIRLPSKVY